MHPENNNNLGERRKDYINIQAQLEIINGSINTQIERAEGKHNVVLGEIRHIRESLNHFNDSHKVIDKKQDEQDLRIKNVEKNFSVCKASHASSEYADDKSKRDLRSNVALVFSGLLVFYTLLKAIVPKMMKHL